MNDFRDLKLDADDPLLDEAQAARLFPPKGISRKTLIRYREQGRIAFVRIAGKIYYRASDIRRCVEEFRVVPRAWRPQPAQ